MSTKKKSWREKLHDDKDLPKRIVLEGPAAEKWGEGTMIIARPRDVDAMMRLIPRGKVTTTDELRAALAEKYHTDLTCPLTTGIFAWIAAHASAEGAAAGEKKITPYWRTLKSKGEINPKFPGGVEAVAALLEKEGQKVVQRGKKWYVADYQSKVVQPEAG